MFTFCLREPTGLTELSLMFALGQVSHVVWPRGGRRAQTDRKGHHTVGWQSKTNISVQQSCLWHNADASIKKIKIKKSPKGEGVGTKENTRWTNVETCWIINFSNYPQRTRGQSGTENESKMSPADPKPLWLSACAAAWSCQKRHRA